MSAAAAHGVILVQVNCASRAEAEAIARAAVDRRLAAAANIHGPIASLYRWRGRLESASEVPLVLKTRAGLFDALEKLIAEMHSYETSCVIGFAPEHISAGYAGWLGQETAPGA